jgi:hypothetical protein
VKVIVPNQASIRPPHDSRPDLAAVVEQALTDLSHAPSFTTSCGRFIGSKKKEFGLLPDEVEQEVDQDRIADDGSTGALTNTEMARLMPDLRPE